VRIADSVWDHFAQKSHPAGSKRAAENVWGQRWFVSLREVSCDFVDRALRNPSHTIHESTRNLTKEHETGVFVQSGGEPCPLTVLTVYVPQTVKTVAVILTRQITALKCGANETF
jgi:hypothetical protein